MKKIILIGSGGHAKACIDVIESMGIFRILGLIDNNFKIGTKVLGYSIIGSDKDLPILAKKYRHLNCHIAIGSIKNQKIRQNLFIKTKKLGLIFPPLISNESYVSKYSKIDEGSIIMHHALVNSNAFIGKNCIINTKSLIEHDCKIGDHSQISTGTIVNSTVNVGKRCFIGSNSVIKQILKIKNDTFIKMGSIISKNI